VASERQNMSEQEISIKAREHELYVQPGSEADEKLVKPFEVYLRETPAEPLSAITKAILAIVSIIVGLLFLGALWRATTHHPPAVRPKTARPAVKTALQRSQLASPVSAPRARAHREDAAFSGDHGDLIALG
jgi:hypothetical protein